MVEREEPPASENEPARASAADRATGPHHHAAESAFQHTSAYRREQEQREAEDQSLVDKGKSAAKRATTLKEKFDRTHAGRMLERVNDGNGMVLAGGIAYFSLTSIAAALVIGVTVASYFISNNSEWNDRFYSFLDETIPGVVGDDDNGLVSPGDIDPESITGVVGAVSFLILFNTATRYLRGMRVGVRTMLGKEAAPPAQGKLRDFIALFSLIIVVVLGIVLQLLASRFAEVLASWFTVEWVSEGIIRGPAIAIGVLLDMAFAALAIVVLGRYKGPRRPLLWALLAAAIAIGVLRQAFSLVVGSLSENAVLGSAIAIVSLLIFVDFIARILLLTSAWLGTNRDVQRVDPELESDAPEPQPRQSGGVTTRRATVRPG